MAANLAIEAAFDFGDVLDVIDVAMRQEQQFKIDTPLFEPFTRALGRVAKTPPQNAS